MNTYTYYSHYNYIFGHSISALMAWRCIASSTLSSMGSLRVSSDSGKAGSSPCRGLRVDWVCAKYYTNTHFFLKTTLV